VTVAEALRILGGDRAEAIALQEAARAAQALADVRESWARVERPLTLRDAVRAYAIAPDGFFRYRATAGSIRDVRDVIQYALTALAGGVAHPVHTAQGAGADEIGRTLDRLVRQYGPDYRLDPIIESALQDRGDSIVDRAVEAALIEAARGGSSEFPAIGPVDLDRAEDQIREMADRTDHQVGHDAVSDGSHSDQTADTHGGDGNSGECAHTAATAAEGRQGGDTMDGEQPDGPSMGNASGPRRSDAARPSGARPDARAQRGTTPTGRGGDRGGDEPTASEMGAQPEPGRDGRDGSPAGNRASATADVASSASGHHGESRSPQGDQASGEAESPVAATFGGRYLSADPVTAARQQATAAREAAVLLSRIIERAVGLSGEASPRVDGRALVREIVSRRMAIDRARRREMATRHLIIAVDESGSCAPTVGAMMGMALEIARRLPVGTVSIVRHSNGYALEAGEMCAPAVRRVLARHAKGLAAYYFSRRQQEASQAAWLDIVRSVDVGLLLHLGDSDAHWIMSDLVRRRVPVLSLEWHAEFGAGETWRVGPVFDSLSAAWALRKYMRRSQ
jgi:hypothetical protein